MFNTVTFSRIEKKSHQFFPQFSGLISDMSSKFFESPILNLKPQNFSRLHGAKISPWNHCLKKMVWKFWLQNWVLGVLAQKWLLTVVASGFGSRIQLLEGRPSSRHTQKSRLVLNVSKGRPLPGMLKNRGSYLTSQKMVLFKENSSRQQFQAAEIEVLISRHRIWGSHFKTPRSSA